MMINAGDGSEEGRKKQRITISWLTKQAS